MRRHTRPDGADRPRCLGEDPGDHGLHGRPGEGRLAGEHLVEQRGERVHVAARVEVLVTGRLLRAHVLGGADGNPGAGERFPPPSPGRLAERLGDPEVSDQRVTPGKQDVRGLDVAVDHAVLVGVSEGVRHLGDEPHGLLQRQRPLAREPVQERLPFHVAHHVEEDPLCLASLEQRHDVGMRELRGDLRLTGEPLAAQIFARRRRQDLDGHCPTERDVPGEVDRGHAAMAQLALDHVAVRQGGGDAREQRITAHRGSNSNCANPSCSWIGPGRQRIGTENRGPP